MVSTKILRLLHFYTFCCCKKTTLFTATTLDSTNTIIQVLAVCASAIGRKCAGKRQKRSEGRGVLYESNSGGSGSLRVSVMSAAESVWWYGFAAGAGVWRRNGGEAESAVVWKQQKSSTRSN